MLDSIRTKTQSLGVKMIFGVIILVFVFWGIGNMSGGSSGALAVVNGEKITLAEYGQHLNRLAPAELKAHPDLFSNAEKFSDFKNRLLGEIIARTLRLQEAKRLGLVVTPHELKAAVDAMTLFQDSEGRFDPERYKLALFGVKLTPGEFEDGMSKDMLESKILRYVAMSADISEAEVREHFNFSMERRFADYVLFDFSEYAGKAVASEEEIAAYYEEHKEEFRTPVMADVDYLLLTPDTLGATYEISDQEIEDRYNADLELYKRPATFQARHIFLACPPEGSSEPEAEQAIASALALAGEVEKKLAAGENFGDLARLYSQDFDSADNGGLLGVIEAGKTEVPTFENAALALEPGAVSKPVRTDYGLHIIKLESKTEAHTVPLVEVKNSIAALLGREKAENDFKNIEREAEEALQSGSSLAALGKKLGVASLNSGLMAQEELELKLSLHKEARVMFADSVAAAAASGKGSVLPVPLSAASGIVLVRINEAKASVIPPAAEVRARLAALVESAKGAEAARKAAEEALPLFTGKETPEAFAGKTQRSMAAMRSFPALEPLGQCPDLVPALFSSSGAWLPAVYESPKGPVIARTAEIEAVTDEQWNQLKGIFLAQYRQNLQNQTLDVFMRDLLLKAEIEQNKDLLDALTPPRQ